MPIHTANGGSMVRSKGRIGSRDRGEKPAERSTKTEQTKVEQTKADAKVESKAVAAEAPLLVDPAVVDEVDLRDQAEVPTKGDLLDDPALLDGVSSGIDIEEQATGRGAIGDDALSLPDAADIVSGDLGVEFSNDLPEEDMLTAEGPVGGLDGRNDAADYGGGGVTTQPGTAAEADALRADALASAGLTTPEASKRAMDIIANDDYSDDLKMEKLEELIVEVKADNAARDQQRFDDLIDDDIAQDSGVEADAPPAAPGVDGLPTDAKGEDAEDGILDTISNALYGRPFMGKSPNVEGGGLIGGANKGSTDGIDMDVGETTVIEVVTDAVKKARAENEDVNKDLGPESGVEAPNLYEDFTEENRAIQAEALLAADIDYGDQVDSATVEFSAVDSDTYAGQYEEPVNDPTAGQVEQATARLIAEGSPDDEFFEE